MIRINFCVKIRLKLRLSCKYFCYVKNLNYLKSLKMRRPNKYEGIIFIFVSYFQVISFNCQRLSFLYSMFRVVRCCSHFRLNTHRPVLINSRALHSMCDTEKYSINKINFLIK